MLQRLRDVSNSHFWNKLQIWPVAMVPGTYVESQWSRGSDTSIYSALLVMIGTKQCIFSLQCSDCTMYSHGETGTEIKGCWCDMWRGLYGVCPHLLKLQKDKGIEVLLSALSEQTGGGHSNHGARIAVHCLIASDTPSLLHLSTWCGVACHRKTEQRKLKKERKGKKGHSTSGNFYKASTMSWNIWST